MERVTELQSVVDDVANGLSTYITFRDILDDLARQTQRMVFW